MIRVRVFEDLKTALMVTHYTATRPGEVGYVSFIPLGPWKPTRPGGAQQG